MNKKGRKLTLTEVNKAVKKKLYIAVTKKGNAHILHRVNFRKDQWAWLSLSYSSHKLIVKTFKESLKYKFSPKSKSKVYVFDDIRDTGFNVKY